MASYLKEVGGFIELDGAGTDKWWAMLDLQARGFSVRVLHQTTASLGQSPAAAEQHLLNHWKFPFNCHNNGSFMVDVPVAHFSDSNGALRVKKWVIDHDITHPVLLKRIVDKLTVPPRY